jgi:GNAT superfamily N-acetyltransferase
VVRIDNVADHPELIECIARWHWNEWGAADPTGSLETWTVGLRKRTNRDRIPLTLVAIDPLGAPIGSVTLVEHDMPDRTDLQHLTPWVAGTFVVEGERRKGVGTALMRRVAVEATRIGVRDLFLYTSTAREFYERLGWKPVRHDFYEGEPVTIMTSRLGLDHANPY